jgi:hypothetical protein
MHSRSLLSLTSVLAVAAALAACSGNDGKISVEDEGGALTDNGGDALFVVKLDEAGREEGYALDGLEVKAAPDGKDAIRVACTPNDANGNQRLDRGETLSCKEGSANDFGAGLSGKEVKVELFAKIDGDEERVGDAKWTPR